MLIILAILFQAFIYGVESSMCKDKDGMNDEIRQMFVDKHNDYRSHIARGKAPNGASGTTLPQAAAMMKVKYSCEIEDDMMDWLKKCKYESNPWTWRKWWGQSLWKTSKLNMNKTQAAKACVREWYEEVKKYGAPQDLVLTLDIAFARNITRFTQMAWQSSYEIGCGVVWCNDMTFAGCEYSPFGNMVDDTIYTPGTPCKTDEDCTRDDRNPPEAKCSPSEALCYEP
ncbi:hypothetical protein V3C99_006681 [Haemonchus contortus]|uniref:Cap-8 n=1 Tax=Haemonchus contortus TaxID=6289 RepID=U6NL16_HAECO|nr:cap-8 [Haemonchus contortus]CDJ82405.1 SCP extracellular domain containing protein [Haemonchus contortus]